MDWPSLAGQGLWAGAGPARRCRAGLSVAVWRGLSPSARWPAESEPAGGSGSRGFGDSPSLPCASFLCQLPALRWEGRVGGPCASGDALRAVPRGWLGEGPAWGVLRPQEPPGSSWPSAVFGSKGPALSRFLARASLRGWRAGRDGHKSELNWDRARTSEVRGKLPPGCLGGRLWGSWGLLCGLLSSSEAGRKRVSGQLGSVSSPSTSSLPLGSQARSGPISALEEGPVPFVLGALASLRSLPAEPAGPVLPSALTLRWRAGCSVVCR